ncbi:MAG: T9SS type A sorting domain-containing protein [Bacteroidia bacterium]
MKPPTNQKQRGFRLERYPNSSADILNVSNQRATIENAVIRIADLTGRIIMTNNVNSKETSVIETLNLSNLSSGVYTISVESAGSREVQKIIKN